MQKLVSLSCPNCGSREIQEDLVCHSCGSRLAWSHDVLSLRLAGINEQCPACGRVNDKANRFCASCAEPLVLACPVCGKEHPQDTLACPVHGVKLLRFQEAVARLREVGSELSRTAADLARFQTSRQLQEEIASLEARRAEGPTAEGPIIDGCAWAFTLVTFAVVGWLLAWVVGWFVAIFVGGLFFESVVNMPTRTFNAIPVHCGRIGALVAIVLTFYAVISNSKAGKKAALQKVEGELRDRRQRLSQIQIRSDVVALHERSLRNLESLLSAYAREFSEPVLTQLQQRARL